jgi:hypothetical protein
MCPVCCFLEKIFLLFLDKFTHFLPLISTQRLRSFWVQILLNSTSWELETHAEAYIAMKKKLGLDEEVFFYLI